MSWLIALAIAAALGAWIKAWLSPPLQPGYTINTRDAGRSYQSLVLRDPTGREVYSQYPDIWGYGATSRKLRRIARHHARFQFDRDGS